MRKFRSTTQNKRSHRKAAVAVRTQYAHLKDVCLGTINGVEVDADLIKSESRIINYVFGHNIKGTFKVRVYMTAGTSRVSTVGRYVVKGTRFPALMYVPGDPNELGYENVLKTPEQPTREARHIKK